MRAPWTRTGAIAALSQTIRSDMMLPDTRKSSDASAVHTGHDLISPLQEWALGGPDRAGDHQTADGRRVGMSDVDSVRQITAAFRELDNRHGGVLSRSAVLAQTDALLALLRTGTYREDIGRALFSATADLASVAAWMSFDAGRHATAQKTFVAALHAAKEGDDKRLGAHILQCMARQMSHLGHVEDALDLVALAQYGARRDLSPTAVSMLSDLEARFQAILGRIPDAEASVARALNAYDRVDGPDEDPHIAFFDLPELRATVGMVHQIAAKHLDGAARARHFRASTELVSAALVERPEHRQRSRAFDHLGLARTYLAGGDVEAAREETDQCLQLLGTVKSLRVVDRLGELYGEAEFFEATAPGRELREQLHDHLAAMV